MYHLQALQERATINILDFPFAGVTRKRYCKKELFKAICHGEKLNWYWQKLDKHLSWPQFLQQNRKDFLIVYHKKARCC